MANLRDSLEKRVLVAIDEYRDLIFEVADRIYAQPEVAMEEHFAAGLLTRVFSDHGFEVNAGVSGMPTAFTAQFTGKAGRPAVGFVAEYDALPNLGHGCGHNLIAASTVAAGLGLRAVLPEIEGSVVVFGTPAEEGGAGKMPMIEEGLFQQVDAVLMVHHGSDKTSAPAVEGAGRCLAVVQHQYEFFGKTAHAAVDPWKGANALNGVIHLFTGVDALRQHVRSHVRIHGIITHGGDAPNVVPRYAAAHFLVRAPTRDEVAEVSAKVQKIAEGAALMTGTEVKVTQIGPLYEEKIPNLTIGRRFNENLGRMGLALTPQETEVGMYSTDFGNVSQVVPACGCNFAISETSIPGHSPEVVAASASELGKANMLKAAKAMALTALELLTEPDVLAAARSEFEAATGK